MSFPECFRHYVGLLTLISMLGQGVLSAADLKILPGHVPRGISQLKATGSVVANKPMRLAIGVPLRDSAGLDAFISRLYDPASTNYHNFLTPDELTARFGPTEQDYDAVKAFARSNGLAIAGTFSNRLVLDVVGPAAAVEKAFHITLHTYQHPTEARQFYAPDTDPSVAPFLPVADVQGLSDFYKPRPRLKKLAVAKSLAKNGSSPDGSGSYFGDDFRNAYVPGTSLTGAGQSVGLLQFDGFYANDIATYAASAGGGRSNISIQTVLLDGYNGVPTTGTYSGNDEVSLDIEMAMAMAPSLSSIVVFEAGPNGYENDVLNSMLSYSATVKQLSSSWGWSGGPSTTTDAIFKSMEAAGQSFFNASGDSDAFTSGSRTVNGVDNTALANAPSSCPYITQVGGTTLTMNGAGGSYSSEKVWNWGIDYGSSYDGVGSSGGVSTYYAIPSWQTNVSNLASAGGSTSYRNIPDVALTADNVYIVSGGSGVGSGGTGGTSCAAPLWAGFMALVNQQAAANGKSSIGFLNPAIYTIAASANYAACFHDITVSSNTWSSSPNRFVATAGYDLCTGLGTPNGTNLINALAGVTDALVVSPAAGYNFSGPAGGAFDPNSISYELTNTSAAAVSWSLINTSAWLNASVTNGHLGAHGSTSLTIALTATANTLALGSYSTSVVFSNLASHAAYVYSFELNVYQPLSVSSANGFTAYGSVGGPFYPGSESLVLSNLGAATIDWSIIGVPDWLTVSATKGLLSAGTTIPVTISLSSSAVTLPAAVYTASLTITNSLGVVAVLPFEISVGQPLVANGGFETGDFTSWTQSGNTAYTQVTSGNANYVHSGSYGAAMGPAYSLGYLSQNLPTTPGQTYLLSLWLRNANGRTPNQFQIQWHGATIFSQANITVTAWTNLQFFVTASNQVTSLQLGFENNPDYFGLDDISVTPLAPIQVNTTVSPARDFKLTWDTTTGLIYQLQYTTNLLQPVWINLGSPITAGSTTMTVTDTNAFDLSPQRFYRLMVAP